MKILTAITLILILLTMGCGFTIHYGGNQFKNAIGGHMVLSILSLISVVILVVNVFLKK